MNNHSLLLLRTMLLSTSKRNYFRYSHDSKAKKQFWGTLFGYGILYLMLIGFCGAAAVGMGLFGFADAIPDICASLILSISFLFTLLKCNAYLFQFAEYDMLMAMPFPVKTIVADKFLYMYIKSLPLTICLSISMLVGYVVGGHVHIWTILAWLIATAVLPMIPMLLACTIGFWISRIVSRFRYKKMLQIVLTIIIVIPCFFLRFFLEDIFRNDKLEDVLTSCKQFFSSVSFYLLPANWFKHSLTPTLNGVLNLLLLLAVSFLVFELFFTLASRKYRQIQSRLHSSSVRKAYRMRSQKSRGICHSIVFKEFRVLLGSPTYFVNAMLGYIMILLLGIAALFVNAETIISVVFQGAPIQADHLVATIPATVYFFVGMVPTTCITPSLEGKQAWIIHSLPITKLEDYHAKLLFQLYVSVPCAVLGILCLAFSFRMSFGLVLFCILVEIAMCLFSALFGLFFGIKFINLDWKNEIEVVKQGKAVGLYILPNMLLTFAILFGCAILPNHYAALTITLVLYLGLSIPLYLGIRSLANK